MKAFEKLNDILFSQLKATCIDFAVFDIAGKPLFDRFRDDEKKVEVTELARKMIGMLKLLPRSLGPQIPEHIILKGTQAFLIFIPSATCKYFYTIFCDNGINSGMVRICIQDAVRSFEKGSSI